MKLRLLMSLVCLTFVQAGCGGNGPSDGTSSAHVPTEVKGVWARPEVRFPPGPPPQDLVVNVLKEGPGIPAKWGQRLRVQYVGLSYRTRKPFEVRWGKSGTFSFNFGSGEVRKGWEIGLKGMRVGGRRELILPSEFAYGSGALLYVVELLAIE